MAETNHHALDPDRYDAVAEAFDRCAERTVWPITQCLIEMTRLRGGEHVLDVACGSGIVTRRAAAVVGRAGRAVGIDLSPGHIHVARQRAQAENSAWCEFIVMDALALDFADATFDVVLAQFPHLPDRARCMAEMFRVLKPGGRFAICNGGGGAPAWPLANAPEQTQVPPAAKLDGLFQRCLKAHFPALVGGPAGSAPVLRDDPHAALRDELQGAGFDAVALWSYAYTAPYYSVAEAFECESIRTSPYRMAKDQLDPDRVEAFEAGYGRAAQAMLDQFGVLGLTSGALFGVGRRMA